MLELIELIPRIEILTQILPFLIRYDATTDGTRCVQEGGVSIGRASLIDYIFAPVPNFALLSFAG